MKNRSIIAFFWKYIKPYKWFYALILFAPFASSFYPFAYNYAIKLFLDAMAEYTNLSYGNILFPIGIFITAQFSLELVWRISEIAAWKAEPPVRRSIILSTYDYLQHHSYKYFQ